MPSHERALVAPHALARRGPAGKDPSGPVAAAERRLADVLAEVTTLDVDVERTAAELADFSRRYEHALGDAFAALDRAERLVLRLQRLEDEVARLALRFREGDLAPAKRKRRGRKARGGPGGSPSSAAFRPDPPPTAALGSEGDRCEAAEVLSEEALLKRLYRRLARVLHPDLAAGDPDRARLSDLMARVNAAYEKRDRTALELMAEKVGAGDPIGELGDDERIAHLAKRAATLGNIAASLRREKDRLDRSQTARLRVEAERRAAEGRDYTEETRAELGEETEAAEADALPRLERLLRAARELARARKTAMSKIVPQGPTAVRRAFDPLQESELVRRGAALLERQRATPAARELARTLEEAAAGRRADAALTLLAFFSESAGRPPDLLESADGWETAWERLRAADAELPPFARVLARLPRHLEVGVRAREGDVVAGVQLAAPELLAGVAIALEREAVAVIARGALAALGPAERCRGCAGEVVGLHLLRTRGLDELNGIVCPACGAVLRSYWRYGGVDGLEALAPFALRLGLVAEVVASLGGTAIGFGVLPREREALTAERLRRRFAELYLAPYGVELAPERVVILQDGDALAPAARFAPAGALELGVASGSGLTAEELLELLRARIERRFRP
jgi:hypothetical protein